MRFSPANPLDQSPLPAPSSLLVHTQSLIADIKNSDEAIARLLKIAALKTCPIVFTPVTDSEVNRILNGFKLDVASYYLQNDNYIVKSTYIEAAFSAETDPVLANSFEVRQGFSLNDSMLMNSGYFHYHLSKIAPRSTDINTLLDVLQVYHIKNRIYKAFPAHDIGQFFYEMCRANRQIHNYKMLFIDLYTLKSAFVNDRELIENLLQSLYDRVLLMDKSILELKYHSLKTVNHNDTTGIMYHLSYFTILVTSSFDNLAWIINYIYTLGFSLNDKSKQKVKWQNVVQPQNKINEAYYKALLIKAPAICNFLLTKRVSCLVDFIYPLRDAIQHRSFIQPLTVGSSINDKLLIWFPKEVKNILQLYFKPEEFGFETEISKLMDRDYYNIYVFSKRVHSEIIELVNTVCGMIDIPGLLSVSPQEIQSLTDAKLNYTNNPDVGRRAQEAIIY